MTDPDAIFAKLDEAARKLDAFIEGGPDLPVRLEALRLAVAGPGEPDRIVARAEAYLRFLRGEPPAPASEQTQ